MASSCRRAQEAIRVHGNSKCSKHYGKEVIYACETCDILVCFDCVTQQHERHSKVLLSDVVPKVKQNLQDYLSRAEQTEIPIIKGKLQKAKVDLSKNKEEVKTRVSQIIERNETLKNELDKIAETLVNTCYDVEHQNSDLLLNYQKELQTQLDKLRSKIQEVKATLQSGNDVLVYDTSHTISPGFEDIPTPSRIAEFTVGQLQLQELERLFGELNTADHNQARLSLSQPANWVMSELTPYKGHYAKSIHGSRDEIWNSFYFSHSSDNVNKMLSVNQEGQVQHTLDMDVYVTDFCISPETGNIWFCSGEDCSVREVKDRKPAVKFSTDTKPLCICVTRNDHVLIGSAQQIVKTTPTGQEICRTSGGSSPVVRYPYHITECPLTNHIAVVDRDWSTSGGENKPFVSILSGQLEVLHTYNGEKLRQSSQIPLKPFDPWDVFYTDTGLLVITDGDNQSIVLVTGTGRYCQTLNNFSESSPAAVCVHGGALWVSFPNEKVQVLKNNYQ